MKSSSVYRSGLIALTAIVASSAWLNNAHARPTYITIDPPDANHQYSSGTWATLVNRKGQVAGQFTAVFQDHWQGFLRNTDGSYVEFEPPGAWDTAVLAINNRGETAGVYSTDYNWNYQHGFFRAADGTLTTFDPPGSTGGTTVTDMNENEPL